MNLVRESITRAPDPLNWVDINREAISHLARELEDNEFELPQWRLPIFVDERDPGESVATVIDYIYVGNSINFQFRDYDSGKKFQAEYGGRTWEGAFGMWACLKRAYENGVPITHGEYLRTLSKEEVAEIFETATGPVIPLIDDRHKILTTVGENLVNHSNGRFSTFIDSSANHLYSQGNGLLERLVEAFPSYLDTAELKTSHGSIQIYFLKRAQLATAILYGRFCGESPFEIKDPQEFTIFADYNIPNVLRDSGVLSYDPSLAELIDSGVVLENNSEFEVEIRIASIRAGDKLLNELNKDREVFLTAPQLDAKLFQLRDTVDTRPHKVRSTNY